VNLLEKNILERLHAGDENAFEYVFRTYYPVLLKYAVQISRDEVAGEEAVEKTLINLWEGRLTIHIGISLKAYLFKSVFNHCLNSIKHWQIKERYLLYFRYHTATDDSGSIISDEYPLSRVLENELEQVLEKQNPPFETNENGFTLSGPVYYNRFKEVTGDFIRKYNVSIFKFDGVGAGNGASGASITYQKDIEAFLQLITDLRMMKPDLFLSLTIGTWPSVYWLKYGDVTWRAGDDTGLGGKGSERQRWMNYRDSETYKNVVMRAPWYPMNALMYHGICIADQGIPGTLEMNDKDIADEIWSFFGSGTSLQEMYINPHKLNSANWDCLAKAIRWARENENTMTDVHWVGGDPAKEEVYGYASWSPGKGLLTLRNPSPAAKTFVVDAARIFELPESSNPEYLFYDVRAGNKNLPLAKGSSFIVSLDPFEVKVFDALPAR